MKLVCAWCGSTIERLGYSPTHDSASHGVCEGCATAFAFEDGVSLQRFIDSLPVPIVLVDKNAEIVGSNLKAGVTPTKKSDGTWDQSFGQVFECTFSRLPEGCGREIHCSGCAIRKAAVQTFETGEPQVSVPATLTTEGPDRPSEVILNVTTIKSNGLVAMHLERVKGQDSRAVWRDS